MKRLSVFMLLCLMTVPAVAVEHLKLLIFPLDNTLPDVSRDDAGEDIGEDISTWIGEGVAQSMSKQLTDAGIRPFSHGEREDLLVENGLPLGVPLSRGSMIFVADQAEADYVVTGGYTENEDGLRLSARLFDMKNLKQEGEFTVSGTLATLPEMENELAWMIYSSLARTPALSREQFRERVRRIPNSAYAGYIESLNMFWESRRIQLLENAIEEYADFAEARFQMGRIYYQKRDYARALTHIEYGLKLPDERVQSEFMIGTCRLQLGETVRAIEDYRRLLDATRHAAALNNLAVAYIRNEDNVMALRTLVEAWAQERDDPSIAINLAIARYLAGDAPGALKFAEEAVKEYPGNGMLHFLSSFMQDEAGNKDQAAANRAQAARFGVDVDKLLLEEPKAWVRVILNWIIL